MIMDDVILKIVKAEHVENYILKLTFSNGEVRLMDFEPLMNKGICIKLRNPDYFKSFSLDHFSIDWNNEIGFDPRYLYDRSILI